MVAAIPAAAIPAVKMAVALTLATAVVIRAIKTTVFVAAIAVAANQLKISRRCPVVAWFNTGPFDANLKGCYNRCK